jgi:hypothetical protein
MREELWAAPLLLLPGVALLVMSTSARYAQIHTEIHQILGEKIQSTLVEQLLSRSRMFRNALVSLYVVVSLFALASLSGGFIMLIDEKASYLVMVLTCAGIGALLFAALQLVRESILSLDIIKDHLEHGRQHHHKDE